MRTLAALALWLAAGAALAQGRPAPAAVVPPVLPQIAASGVGELRLAPARATLHLVVETTAGDAADAAQDNARRVTRVRRALEKHGVPAEAIENAGYGLHRQQKDGFVARHRLAVSLNTTQVGPVIDAALAAGANTVVDIVFHPADAEEAKNKALAAAVKQARAHAEAMAAAAGGRLGELIEIEYADGGPRPFAAVSRAAAETDVSRAEIVITERVQARWRFVPGKR